MNNLLPYRIFPLGDNALTIDFGNKIDEEINKQVINWFYVLEAHPICGLIDIVPAYSSLTIYYDTSKLYKRIGKEHTVYDWVREKAEQLILQPDQLTIPEARTIVVPVCYDPVYGPDIEKMAAQKKISAQELAALHHSRPYRVYMMGFLPGFAYLGSVDSHIALPRKDYPEKVLPGSVAIGGNQTGIYALESPGGWQVIGRTPLKLFNPEAEQITLLRAGDTVQFVSISKDEFKNY